MAERKVAVDSRGEVHDCGKATNAYTHAVLKWDNDQYRGGEEGGAWDLYSRHRSFAAATSFAAEAAKRKAYGSTEFAVVELEVRTDG